MGDIRGDIRRYLVARYQSGMDVAYRIARPEAGAAPAPTAGEERPQAPSAKPVQAASSKRAPAPSVESPQPARDEIPLVTTAVPADDIGGRVERLRRGESIHYTRDKGAASQVSLFGDPEKALTMNLGGCDLAALERLVSTCERCGLSHGRTRTVFGSGNPRSRIVFVGEAPGREEDLQGLPFVGRAGQLLTKILAAMGLTRDEVYITNILKCRPPGNREPQDDEMVACEPYLVRQLEIISPAIICALGRIAGHGLLKTQASLGALRQGLHFYNDIRVAVTYHPAALLRNPNLKRDAWEDFQMVRRLYDEALREGA